MPKVLGRRIRHDFGRLMSNPVALTVLAGGSSTIVRVAITLITMPALLEYLGAEGLGFWLVAQSFMALIGFVNGGLSGAIITAVGRVNIGEGRHIHRLATTATVLATIIGLATLILLLPLVFVVDWYTLFSLSSTVAPEQATWTMAVLVFCLAIGFPASVPKFVLVGKLEGYTAHLIELVAVLVAGAALFWAIWSRQPIHILALSFMVPQPIIMKIIGGACLWRAGINLWSIRDFDRSEIASLFREGTKLAVNQASFAIGTQTDLLLIGMIAGAAAGVGYGVAFRLFGLLMIFVNIVNGAIWPAYCQADAAGRTIWVRQAYLKLIVTLLGTVGIAVAGITLFYDRIIETWFGQALDTDWLLVGGMAVWVLVAVATSTTGTLLLALRKTTLQSTLITAMMLVNVPVSILLIHQIGAAGAIWGTVISYAICLIIPYVFFIPKLFASRMVCEGDITACENRP